LAGTSVPVNFFVENSVGSRAAAFLLPRISPELTGSLRCMAGTDIGACQRNQRRVSEPLGRPEVPAADAIAELIASLGLPTRLRDVGVASEQVDLIAAGSMHDRWVHTNPRKIDGPAAIRTLLDAAW
jgi:alcohol dehydrogenase class IV